MSCSSFQIGKFKCGMIILWPCEMIMLDQLTSKLLQFTTLNIWLWRDMKLDIAMLNKNNGHVKICSTNTLSEKSIILDCHPPAFRWLDSCWFKNGDDAWYRVDTLNVHSAMNQHVISIDGVWHHQQENDILFVQCPLNPCWTMNTSLHASTAMLNLQTLQQQQQQQQQQQ